MAFPKLSEEIVKAIFEARKKGLTIPQIANELGINKNTVYKYLKIYGSYENYLAILKEKEYKKTAFTPVPAVTTAVRRMIDREVIDYSTKYLAKQHAIYKIFESELEELANKLDVDIEELLRLMIYYFKKIPEYLKLKEENLKLKEELQSYKEVVNLIVSLLDEELFRRLKELVAINTAIETKSKEFLLKLIGG